MISRPDGCWEELIGGEGTTRAEQAQRAGAGLICAGYVLERAGVSASNSQDAHRVFGSDSRAALFANIKDANREVAEDLATEVEALGMMDWQWVHEIVRKLIASKISSPEILDWVADWIAPYLVEPNS